MRTLGYYAFALQAGGSGSSQVPDEVGIDFVELIIRSSPLSKIVLVILLVFSALSWAIVLYKMFQYRRADRHSASFLDIFRKSAKFSEVQAVCRTLTESPLVGLFQAGYAELNTQLRQSPHGNPGENRPSASAVRPTLKSLDAVDRALLRASAIELEKLERRVPFLATTASITPFIGLFGTVWGIMTAFQRIGAAGATSLGVVAPGIAEALIATAAGLFAAIPAVYFYNAFTNRVKRFATEMDDFSLEFLNIAERNFT
ncbi:MAG TPA: MotA/TolQ/ExbB proton channel family protein [Vicinamibacterales bacterium]|nr:MotA/TolQ/ExbB proton channel family protein [Vicinamibacterales bacterium]